MVKKAMMKVSVTVIPLQGNPKKKELEVPITVTGTTVREILSELGVDLKGKNIMVSGKPATQETIVMNSEEVKVVVTERPKGS